MQGEIEYHTKERVTIKDISAKLGISSIGRKGRHDG